MEARKRKLVQSVGIALAVYAIAFSLMAGMVCTTTRALAGQASKVAPVNTNLFGTALKGYDPVAYFEDGKPVKGKDEFRHDWNGGKWYVTTAAHRDAFAKNPAKYAPQFGGYCSWAVGHNYTADIDPEAWSIVDGKLYLNYNKDIQKKWSLDIPGYIQKANDNWPTLHK